MRAIVENGNLNIQLYISQKERRPKKNSGLGGLHGGKRRRNVSFFLSFDILVQTYIMISVIYSAKKTSHNKNDY
jgi:hypothetical protein